MCIAMFLMILQATAVLLKDIATLRMPSSDKNSSENKENTHQENNQ